MLFMSISTWAPDKRDEAVVVMDAEAAMKLL